MIIGKVRTPQHVQYIAGSLSMDEISSHRYNTQSLKYIKITTANPQTALKSLHGPTKKLTNTLQKRCLDASCRKQYFFYPNDIENGSASEISTSAQKSIQEPVNTGNSQLDDAINKLYHCISNTHYVPPTIEKVDNYY